MASKSTKLSWYEILPRFLWYKFKETWWLLIIPIIEFFPIRLWLVPYIREGITLTKDAEASRIFISWLLANLIAIPMLLLLFLFGMLAYAACEKLVEWIADNWNKAKEDELRARRIYK